MLGKTIMTAGCELLNLTDATIMPMSVRWTQDSISSFNVVVKSKALNKGTLGRPGATSSPGDIANTSLPLPTHYLRKDRHDCGSCRIVISVGDDSDRYTNAAALHVLVPLQHASVIEDPIQRHMDRHLDKITGDDVIHAGTKM